MTSCPTCAHRLIGNYCCKCKAHTSTPRPKTDLEEACEHISDLVRALESWGIYGPVILKADDFLKRVDKIRANDSIPNG